MTDFQWDESHIDWFVSFFEEKSDVKASSFTRLDIPGIGRKPIHKQDRRNLMELVVKKGLAVAVVGKPCDNNYCVCLLPGDIEKHHFSQQMLFDDRINDLPQSAWLKHRLLSVAIWPMSENFLYQWLECKLEWMEIINLLRVYQVKGQLGKENLQQDWDTRQQEFLLLKAEQKAKMYTLVRVGWGLADLTYDGEYSTPEDLFLDMLFAAAELDYGERHEQVLKSIHRRYEELKQVVHFKECGGFTGDYVEEDAREILMSMWRERTREIKLSGGEVAHSRFTRYLLFAGGSWLLDLAKECSSAEMKKAAEDFAAVGHLNMRRELSNLNRERNKPKAPFQRE
jgi:hypothetical protein